MSTFRTAGSAAAAPTGHRALLCVVALASLAGLSAPAVAAGPSGVRP